LSRRAAQVILAGGEFGRPLVATPGTPRERLNILREAFAKSMKDPELLAETKKSKMDVDLSTAEELQALIKEVMEQPKEVNERVKKFLGN
jgi:tripartite-type tricarboxylate transporter receptor subunit TctC